MKNAAIFGSGAVAGTVLIIGAFFFVRPLRQKTIRTGVNIFMYGVKNDAEMKEVALRLAHDFINLYEKD
jgi:hypothetical protein